MPKPTPPHWWRYSTKRNPHEHVIDEIELIEEGGELWDHHRTPGGEGAITPMHYNPRFLNEREAEVFLVGSLLRETQAQDNLYDRYWNHTYVYVLQPTQNIAEALASDRAYVCTLRVTGNMQGNFGHNDIPPPPDVGSDVKIIDRDDEHEFAGFVQAVDDDNTVTMIVTTTKGSAAFVLNDRRGLFRFGNPGQAFVTVKRSIQRLLWSEQQPGYVPWIRVLALAHENQAIPTADPPAVTGWWRRNFPPLNPYQEYALRQNVHRGIEIQDRMVIIQGPPGTGKTEVIAQTCVDCLERNRKFLVVAETRYAVQVAADAIKKALATAQMQVHRVFFIEHTGVEGMEFGMEELLDDGSSGAPRGPHDVADMEDAPPMSETSRLNVVNQLQALLKQKPFSLDAYMKMRLDLFKETPRALAQEERRLVLEVIKY